METLWNSLFAAGFAIAAVVVLGLALAALCWMGLFIHELGHAVPAWLCRFRIFEFRIGSGRPAFVRRLGPTQICLAPLPSGGLITYLPLHTRWYRLRSIAGLCGGPLANVATGAAALWLAHHSAPASRYQLLEFLLTGLGYISGGLALASLLPYYTTLFGRRFPTDGLQILQLLFTRQDPSQAVHFCYLREGLSLYEVNLPQKAARWLRRALRHSQVRAEHPVASTCALILAEAGHVDEAHQILSGMLESTFSSPVSVQWRDTADVLGSLPIYFKRPDLLLEAKQVLQTAVADFPSHITLRGTLGGVLFELGETEEAEPMLEEVLATSDAAIDRSLAAAYLAHIWNERGCIDRAKEHAEKALKEIPASGGARNLVQRLVSELELRDTPVPTRA